MKLSIITINYNNAEGLRKTLASVASQTFRDFEHIIVDGGSTDGSVEIIEAYASDMARMASGSVLMGTNGDFVAVDSPDSTLANGAQPHEVTQPVASTQPSIKWISEKDKGIYNAMNKGIEIALGRRVVNAFNRSELVEDKNKGIKMANGEYLLFLNSGDYLVDENVVENIMQLALKDDICYGYQMNEIDGRLVEEICIDPSYITFDTMRNAHIPHQSSLIKLDTLVRLGGYDESNKIVSDWAYVMKCLFMHNGTITRIPVNIAVYDMNGISSVADKTPQWAERRKVLLQYFPRIMPDYDRWDRLNKTMYMRLVKLMRNFKNTLCHKRN